MLNSEGRPFATGRERFCNGCIYQKMGVADGWTTASCCLPILPVLKKQDGCVRCENYHSNLEWEHEEEDTMETEETETEQVNHPKHYQSEDGMEVIKVIESFRLGFNLGNVVKYVLRCGKKDDPRQELKKARWYLDREIRLMEGGDEP